MVRATDRCIWSGGSSPSAMSWIGVVPMGALIVLLPAPAIMESV
jgi:hypothetical protein